jgi:hypothetical protein
MPSFMEDGRLFNFGLKMILYTMFVWWCDIMYETTRYIINLFIHLSFIYNCTLIWSYFFTVFFLFTFFCIFSSTSMLEIKTIYTPKGINVFKTFFFNLFQLENQMINKYYGTKKKYAFNIPIIWVWFTFAL